MGYGRQQLANLIELGAVRRNSIGFASSMKDIQNLNLMMLIDFIQLRFIFVTSAG